MAYNINYNDKRFTQVNNEKNVALKENETTYNGMINNADKYYKAQEEAVQNYADTQSKLQQEQTDFTIDKIEQQKEQAQKDYIKEQSGAYVDWQKQSNKYGANAEQMAAGGLANSGYSESSQVSMYNTYQNRVATARDTFNRAVLDFDNGMREAMLQNNSMLAEIQFNALQKKLELSLQGFQYKNQLILSKAEQKASIEDRYYTRYQNVLSQINTENALAEQVRQYNESLAEERRQFNMSFSKRSSSGSSGSGGSGGSNIEKSDNGNTKKDTNKKGATNYISTRKYNDLTQPFSTKTGTSVDWNSIKNLGYGPIDLAAVEELENKGIIKSTVSKNGVVSYQKVKG